MPVRVQRSSVGPLFRPARNVRLAPIPLLALVALLTAGAGCATAPQPPVWPVYGTAYEFVMEQNQVFHVTFQDPSALEWKRLKGVETVSSGTRPYRLEQLNGGMKLITWRTVDGMTVTLVTDTFSWEVAATVSRPGDPLVMHGRVRPASRTAGGGAAGDGADHPEGGKENGS